MVQGGLKKVQGGLEPPWHPTSRAYGTVSYGAHAVYTGPYGGPTRFLVLLGLGTVLRMQSTTNSKCSSKISENKVSGRSWVKHLVSKIFHVRNFSMGPYT